MTDAAEPEKRRPLTHALSRRERQVMDGLYQHGPSTASDVQAFLSDPPSYSAVRALLRTLEDKGHVQHEHSGTRYVYRPVTERVHESQTALHHLVRTFFDGSVTSVVAALLNNRESLAAVELDALQQLIDDAKAEGR